MTSSLFGEISILVTLGALMALLMRLLKQPLIISHIITGLIVGIPSLHLIKSTETIDVFANIGVALLLFIIGLGLNPRVIKDVGRVAFVVGFVQVVAVFGYTALLGILLDRPVVESMIIGTALSFSSTIIILKLLSDKKEQGRLYGKLTIGLLIVQDLIATIALLFLSARSDGGLSLHKLGTLGLKGLAIAVPLFLCTYFILPKLHTIIAGSQEFLFLFAIGWGFGIAALFEKAGFSLEIGSLIAGVSLASLPYATEISTRLRPLRDFFVIIFFIGLGLHLKLDHLGDILGYSLLFTLVVFVLKPLIVLVGLGLSGYTKGTSFRASITLGQISEFSLVFLLIAEREGLVATSMVTSVTLVALVTIALSSYMIIYADKLYKAIEYHLRLFERHLIKHERDESHRYDIVQFGYVRGGTELARVFRDMAPHKFLVVDYNPDSIELLDRRGYKYLYGDATDPELLDEIGIHHVKIIVSIITDFNINSYLVKHITKLNPEVVFICHAETATEATELYEFGASYIIMPNYIGSERMSQFVHKNGFRKTAFKEYREKHLAYLQAHFSELSPELDA